MESPDYGFSCGESREQCCINLDYTSYEELSKNTSNTRYPVSSEVDDKIASIKKGIKLLDQQLKLSTLDEAKVKTRNLEKNCVVLSNSAHPQTCTNSLLPSPLLSPKLEIYHNSRMSDYSPPYCNTTCQSPNENVRFFDKRTNFYINNKAQTYMKDRYKSKASSASHIPVKDKFTSPTSSLCCDDSEFIADVIKKNKILREVIRNMVVQKEKEKAKQHWDNYINILKIKHNGNKSMPSISEKQVKNQQPYSNNFNNFNYEPPCKKIETTFSTPKTYNVTHTDWGYASDNVSKDINANINPFCYPLQPYTNYTSRTRDECPFIEENTEVTCPHKQALIELSNILKRKELKTENEKIRQRFKILDDGDTAMDKNNNNLLETVPEEALNNEKSSRAKETSNKKSYRPQRSISVDRKYLENIECKLDKLVDSFKDFTSELKNKNSHKKKVYRKLPTKDTGCEMHCVGKAHSDSFSVNANENIITNMERVLYAESEVKLKESVKVVTERSHEMKFNGNKLIENKISNNVRSIINDKETRKIVLPFDKCREYPKSVHITIDFITDDKIEQNTDESYESVKHSGKNDNTMACHRNPVETVTNESLNRDSGVDMNIKENTFCLQDLPMMAFQKFVSIIPQIKKCLSLFSLPHLMPDEDRLIVCSQCGLRFPSIDEFKNHVSSHHRSEQCIRPTQSEFSVSICTKRTNKSQSPGQSSKPNRQQSNQTGNKMFTCHHCGKGFMRAYCCQLHETTCKGFDTKDDCYGLVLK